MQFNKTCTNNTTSDKLLKEKKADISRIPSPIFSRPSKSVLAKSKFYKKNQSLTLELKSNNKSYVQASKSNISEIIKIKEAFSKLSSNKVSEIHRVINDLGYKGKPKLNMISKDLSQKQIIISMGTNNAENIHVENINRLLKNIKSEVSADYIHSDNKGIIVILNVMEKYIKGLNNVDSNDIMSPRLSQSKFYLKILDILYFVENTNLSIIPNIIERVIQSNHIFNDLVLVS